MATNHSGDHAARVTHPPTSPRRRPSLAWWLAATWAVGYLFLGLVWALGGPGFPYAANGHGPRSNLLDLVPATVGGGVLATVAAVAVVLLARAVRKPSQPAAVLVIAVGVVLAVLLTDVRVLMVAGYLVVMLAGVAAGRVDPGLIPTMAVWSNLNQFVLMAAGVCLIRVGVSILGAGAAGRNTDVTWRRSLRVGRWAVLVAVLVPVGYAATRWAWALGIRLGISDEFWRAGAAADAWWIGAGLGTAGVVGALLTVGLVCRWGEVWPRWVPFLHGRSIPARFPAYSAFAVSVAITSAGLMYVRLKLAGGAVGPSGAENEIGAWLPEMFWPVWGAGLALAGAAYLVRRRTGRLLPDRS